MSNTDFDRFDPKEEANYRGLVDQRYPRVPGPQEFFPMRGLPVNRDPPRQYTQYGRLAPNVYDYAAERFNDRDSLQEALWRTDPSGATARERYTARASQFIAEFGSVFPSTDDTAADDRLRRRNSTRHGHRNGNATKFDSKNKSKVKSKDWGEKHRSGESTNPKYHRKDDRDRKQTANRRRDK